MSLMPEAFRSSRQIFQTRSTCPLNEKSATAFAWAQVNSLTKAQKEIIVDGTSTDSSHGRVAVTSGFAPVDDEALNGFPSWQSERSKWSEGGTRHDLMIDPRGINNKPFNWLESSVWFPKRTPEGSSTQNV